MAEEARATQVWLEVLSGSDNSLARATQFWLEVLSGSDNSQARTSVVWLEVVRSKAEAPTFRRIFY